MPKSWWSNRPDLRRLATRNQRISMLRKMLLPTILLPLAFSPVVGVTAPAAPATLSAADIVARDIEAKGGRGPGGAVKTLSFSGKMDAGGKQHTQLPFLLEMKRPRKS